MAIGCSAEPAGAPAIATARSRRATLPLRCHAGAISRSPAVSRSRSSLASLLPSCPQSPRSPDSRTRDVTRAEKPGPVECRRLRAPANRDEPQRRCPPGSPSCPSRAKRPSLQIRDHDDLPPRRWARGQPRGGARKAILQVARVDSPAIGRRAQLGRGGLRGCASGATPAAVGNAHAVADVDDDGAGGPRIPRRRARLASTRSVPPARRRRAPRSRPAPASAAHPTAAASAPPPFATAARIAGSETPRASRGACAADG